MEDLSATKRESRGFYKLSSVQRIGFGAGDLAQNLIYQTVSMYLLIFYTIVSKHIFQTFFSKYV